MENQILSHASEQLIPGLSYTLGPTAQFVRARHCTTFFPSGGNQYSVTGVRVLRFELQSGGDMFLDPATLSLAFTLKNNNATAGNLLTPLSNSPLCFFQRMRVLMKGTLVEDINYLHRIEHLFDILLPPQRRRTQAMQMFGEKNNSFNVRTRIDNETIAGGSARKVMTPLLSGLLSAAQPHWIPLKLAPITVELEVNPLVNQYLSTAANTSTNWSLEDAQIKVDLCDVDAFLADKVYGLIRSSGLQFSFASYNTIMNVLPAVSHTNGQVSTQFARSYHRIKTIFITFGTGEYATAGTLLNETNGFYWPARNPVGGTDAQIAAYPNYNYDRDKVEFQLHVGSETYPQYPVRSLAEFAYHLEKALDLTASVEGVSISPHEYRTDKFVIGLDVEKAGTGPGGGAEFTGLDTSVGGGSNIRIEMKNIDTENGQQVDRIYLTLVHNVIAVLEERGVTVLD